MPGKVDVKEDGVGVDQLIHGDVLKVLPKYPANTFHGCLADPPYELKYMERKWDSSGIAFDVSMWKEVHRVLTPGAYLLAFGSPRTHHHLMVALEDAGFEIIDVLMWCYTSGFPKAKSCLKPAWEPIILACKSSNKIQPLNIDACRIGTETRWNKSANNISGSGWGMRPRYDNNKQAGQVVTGRWPANLILAKEVNHWFSCSKASKKEKNAGLKTSNPHPTVKPLALCQWLATLIKPTTSDATGDAARLLVPFSGSGSEMIGGLRAGWARVTGIELEPGYIEIAKARLSYWIADLWNKSKRSGGSRAGAGRKPIPILCPWCREVQPSTRKWRDHMRNCRKRNEDMVGNVPVKSQEQVAGLIL